LRITGATKVVGVFGDPVEHTVSPAMHNAAFLALGIDMVYLPLRVFAEPISELGDAIKGIKAMNMRGVNITIPHKENAIKYLDEIDEHAAEIGAVNTVVNKNGLLVGYNTDGPGYLLSLRKYTGFIPEGKRILIFGAGGASRAVVYAILAARPASLLIANRTIERAVALKDKFGARFKEVEVNVTTPDSALTREFAKEADLVVNTTPLGMGGKGAPGIPVEDLSESAVVSDIVYTPLETGFLKRAKERGLKTHDGLSMLVKQGAVTFELWTGQRAPLDIMRQAALQALSH